MKRQRRRARGQGLVETAVVITFMVLLLLGIIGFGSVMAATVRLEAAAREGARQGAMGQSNATIQTMALQTLSQTGNAADVPGTYWMAITPTAQSSRTFNTQVKVEIWWNYPVPVPVFNFFSSSRLLYAYNVQSVTTNPPSS
jgi:Flp pilus assembly protein TadG